MDNLSLVLEKAMLKFKEENGIDATWEVGDSMAIVCDDAVVTIEMEEGRELKVNVIAGKPYKFDIKLNLCEEVADGR